MLTKDVVIIGGGVAGLAFAIRYRQLGGKVRLFERSAMSGREGLGFIVMENGMRALEKLGLGDKLADSGVALSDCIIHDDSGRHLMCKTIDGAYGMSRKTFMNTLMSEIPSPWLSFNNQFSHFIKGENNQATAAVFTDGTQVNADFFLGSDGIRSKVRSSIFPTASTSPVKVCELVSIIRAPELVADLGSTFTKSRKLDGGLAMGMVPVDEEHLVWFLQFDAKRYPLQNDSAAGKFEFARRLIGDWHDPASYLLEHTDFRKTHLWRTCYLNPLSSYHQGNVVLLGDAAHAMLTFTSQGINAAIEDAVLLAETMAAAPAHTAELAFKRYSETRKQEILPFLDQGIELQQEFLSPYEISQGVPLAFTA